MVMEERKEIPKPTKPYLGSAGRGGRRMTKTVTLFCYLLAALRCCLAGELPPPRSHHPVHLLQAPLSCHPLPPPCLGFAPRKVEYWPLWDTSSQLKHCCQPAVHGSLPPAILLQASSFLPSQEQGVRSVLQPKTFCRASEHERSCAKVGMAAGATISTPAPPPPSPFLLASFHVLPTPT